MEHASLLLINEMTFGASGVTAQCVVVDPIRGIDQEVCDWDAWITGQTQQQIRCRIPGVDYIVQRFTGDDEDAIPDDVRLANRIVSAAGNLYEYELEGIDQAAWLMANLDAPRKAMFISESSGLRPSISDVTVRLRLKTLSEFPDALAYVAFQRSLSWHSDQFANAAAEMRPQSGQIFPIEIRATVRTVRGAVILREQIKTAHFSARIILSEDPPPITVGTLLHRYVQWERVGTTGRSEAVIAEVTDV